MINQAQKSPQERRRGAGFETGELPIPSVRDVLRVAFRHKYIIATIFVLAGLAGAGVSMLLPEKWQSEGRIMLREERTGLRINPGTEGLVTADPQFDNAAGDSELAIMTSQSLAQEVAEKVGLERVLSLKDGKTIEEAFKGEADPHTAAVRTATKTLLQNATIEPANGIIWLVYEHNDPVTARDILDTWMNAYIDRHIQMHSSSAKPELIQNEMDERKRELDRLETELNKYKTENGVAAATQELGTVGQQVNDLETRLAETQTQIEAEKARIAALEEALKGRGDADIKPMEMANPDWTAYDERLRELEIERIEVGSREVNTPTTRSLDKSIAEIRMKRDKLPRTVPRTAGSDNGVDAMDPALQLQAAQVNLSGLQAMEATYLQQLEPMREHLVKLRTVEPRMVQLEREVASARDLYEAARNSLVQAQTSETLDASKVSNVRIVDEATLPDERTSPRRTRLTLMAAFGGLIVGFGFAFVREFFDATIKSREEAEKKLGITVLAVVPEREFKKCI